jgi:hypothetical protein
MPNTWTPERRAAQAERIRALKPWLKSTGPKTKAGKKRSSKNAVQHGLRKAEVEKVKRLIRLNREFLRLTARVFTDPEAFTLTKRTKEKPQK